jgi:hypothetical protein
MKKRILIISRNGKPMPPRTQMILDVLQERYEVDLVDVKPVNDWKRRINYLTFYYFDLVNIKRLKSRIKDYDAVMIKDLQFLPLAKEAKKQAKFVVYETLDFNPQLRYYGLCAQFPVLKNFPQIQKKAEQAELKLVRKYVDRLLVNSDALNEHFGGKAIVNYYSSPFEGQGIRNKAELKPALLYLGHFSEEKGALDMLQISSELDWPLFIYGGVAETQLQNIIKANEKAIQYDRMPADALTKELKDLMQRYFLFGFSLIRDANASYAVQNANKDIDYLAMGIPLIGNRRKTTGALIEAGCGIYGENAAELKEISDGQKKAWKNRCLEVYNKRFANAQFRKNLLTAFNDL